MTDLVNNYCIPKEPTETVFINVHPALGPVAVDKEEFIQKEIKSRELKKYRSLTPNNQYNLYEYEARVKALEIATKTALQINLFEKHYPNGLQGILRDVEDVHKIADMNFRYIMGEK